MSANWYDRHLLPHLLDLAMGLRPIARQRRKVVPLAAGRVLEVGIGTGRNLPFYDAARVRCIVGVEPSLQLHRLALRRIDAAGIAVRLVGAGGERLPVADASFDTVISTFTMCTIPEPLQALREARRVLAPGGRLVFLEHGLAPEAGVRAWQARLQPLWGPLAGGCVLGRDIPALLREAGFDATIERGYVSGPRIVSYHYWGQAVAV